MMIWKSDQKNSDKIIAYTNQTIYKANPKAEEIDQQILKLKMQDISPGIFFGIPLQYISTINLQDGKAYIEIVFRGDTEHLRITDSAKRIEIFEYLKSNLPGASYHVEKYTKLKSGKKPLIAMCVLLPAFLWALYIAIGKASGNDYDVTGQHYNSVAGIVLVLASLGVKNLILLFASIFSVTLFSFVRKIKNPPVIEQLLFVR